MNNILKILALVFSLGFLFSLGKLVFIASSDVIGDLKNPIYFYLFAILVSTLVLMMVSRLLIANQSSDLEDKIQGLEVSLQEEKEKVKMMDGKVIQMEEGNRFALMIADFAALMQASSELKVLADNVIIKLCTELEASQGAFFIKFSRENVSHLRLISGYAYHVAETNEVVFEFGEGLAGQVAKEGKIFNFDSVPEGYVQVLSGLGESTPKHLIILPLINEKEVLGVIEIASFKAFNEGHVEFLNKLSSLFGAGLRRIINENMTQNYNLINGIQEGHKTELGGLNSSEIL